MGLKLFVLEAFVESAVVGNPDLVHLEEFNAMRKVVESIQWHILQNQN